MAIPPEVIDDPMSDMRTIRFRFFSDRGESVPLNIVTHLNGWHGEKMERVAVPVPASKPCFEHSCIVPKDTYSVLFKFRYGDHEYFYDSSLDTETDDDGNVNNRFVLPPPVFPEDHDPVPEYSNHFDGSISEPSTPRNSTISPALSASTWQSVSESDRWTVLDEDDADDWL